MIRTAVESDAGALAALSVQLGYPSSPAEIAERLEGIQARAEGQVIVAENWAAAMQYAKVSVRSNVIREDAHRFYTRLGYRETKRQAVLSRELPGTAGAEP
jgi:hypothetical protein